jgi:hypothetical protein
MAGSSGLTATRCAGLSSICGWVQMGLKDYGKLKVREEVT